MNFDPIRWKGPWSFHNSGVIDKAIYSSLEQKKNKKNYSYL